MSSDCFVIAIDGPAGAGKSTTSRRVAERLGFGYLDSGGLYRCVGLAALEAGVDLEDDDALAVLVAKLDIATAEGGQRFLLNGRDVTASLRDPEVSQAASKTSACPSVRRVLLDWQREAVGSPGTVIEGRDIGTVVFPGADLKVFLDADPEERARRRTVELEETMGQAERAGVRSEMAERDRRDTTRRLAPLKAAADAVVVDTTELGLAQVVDRVVSEVKRRMSRK